jgi:hypothetical protein
VVFFLLVFPPKSYFHGSSPHACYIPCPSHSTLLDHSDYAWQTVQITKPLIMQFSPTSYHFIRFSPNILLSTLFSNTLCLCTSFNVRDQVSHPYRTTGKIIVLYKKTKKAHGFSPQANYTDRATAACQRS